uniref:Uncharacterized protein n=1 Tax=Haptolina ericina TaxID=156174 RepID=A0A7S3B291_9EUKA|mmetsp:Transcript_4801/g.10366  ORF Transcript_4801/g.10366 Transcript_4801/m.10366 type:complete len:321 (+) Transcript_4801:449-1411(+)
MIALAMLPSFTTENIRYLFGSKIVSPYFMVFPASFAYVIKLFYFDVADDHHKIEHQRAQTELEARHALQHQTEGRWRATLWIATHVVLIIAVCAVGRSINKVLLPWDGYPDDTLYADLQTRYLIAGPISIILLMLTLQHALHVGGGSGLRRIGRRHRLACRVVTAVLILLLPLTSIGDPNYTGEERACQPSVMPPPMPPEAPIIPPGSPPLSSTPPNSPPSADRRWLASRTFFFSMLLLILLAQLFLELYGRGYARNADDSLAFRTVREKGSDRRDGIDVDRDGPQIELKGCTTTPPDAGAGAGVSERVALTNGAQSSDI